MLLNKSSSCGTARHIRHMEEVGGLEPKGNILHCNHTMNISRLQVLQMTVICSAEETWWLTLKQISKPKIAKYSNSMQCCVTRITACTANRSEAAQVLSLGSKRVHLLKPQLSHESHRHVDCQVVQDTGLHHPLDQGPPLLSEHLLACCA